MRFLSRPHIAWLRQTNLVGVIFGAVCVAGCGGGGDGAGTDNTQQSATANATLSVSEVKSTTDAVTTTYEAASMRVDFGARAHLSDVGPMPDSPGKGTTIMVIDDFSSLHASTTTLPTMTRTINAQSSSERYSATYQVQYQVDTAFTHGDLVSNIAGGYGQVPASTLTLKAVSSNLASCTRSYQTTQLSCLTTFHATAPTSTLTAQLSMAAIPGVASEATLLRSPINLSSSQNALTTNASLYGFLRSSLLSSDVDVVNLSLGSDMPTSSDIVKDLQSIVDAQKIDFPIHAVIAVAAGNSGTPCSVNYFGCNTMAIAMSLQPTTYDSALVVGALTGSGTAQKIADYSTRPGDLASRFIYASGDTGFYASTSGSNAVGTSFAAPRVAGVAAILKQKFPALTSAQIASIILLSADKDMNNDGTPDFSGVHPIYGNGKLSLKNALTLAATY